MYKEIGNERYAEKATTNLATTLKRGGQGEKAIKMYFESLDYNQKINNRASLALNLQSIGQYYEVIGKFDSAYFYSMKAKELKELLGIKSNLPTTLNTLTTIFIKTKKFKEAREYNERTLALSDSLGILDELVYAKANDFEISYFEKDINRMYTVHNRLLGLSDSLKGINTKKEVIRLEKLYETAQKEKEIALTNAKLQQTRQSRTYILTGSGILLLMLIFSMLQYRKKQVAYKALVMKSREAVNREKAENNKRIKKISKNGSGDQSEKLFNQILKLIESDKIHHKPGLTIDNVAEKLNTNREYVSQAVNAHFGRFNDFINHHRVNDIVEVLSNPDHPDNRYTLDIIAKQIGFRSMSTFIQAFKNETGLTPAKFRKNAEMKAV
jgi:AraC-like DNA-binding protein